MRRNRYISAMRSYLGLIEKWEAFLAEHPEGSLEEFGAYVLAGGGPASPSAPSAPGPEAPFEGQDSDAAVLNYHFEASNLLWRLGKHAKSHAKGLFEDLGISSHDELAILSHVALLGECPKKVAVPDNLVEMSTGIDTIKRLLNKGQLLERKNPRDKRESLVRIAAAGRGLLEQVSRGFGQLPDVLGGISREEQRLLLRLLERLDEFHLQGGRGLDDA